MTHRICEACGFENAESAKACPLCGTRAIDEYALIDAGTHEARPSVAPRSSPETTRGHTCSSCSKGYIVSYECQSGESEQVVPVACPHCWQTSEVSVGRAAAEGQDYRVEQA